ncbi:MAG: OmpH family outer membrane protein [Luteolibacter sp.]
MKFIVTSLWLALVAISFAAPTKFAVVRVTDIYRALPSTAALQKKVVGEREAIMGNKRAEQLRAIIGVLQSLQLELNARKNDLENPETKKLVRDYEIKRQEAQTLQQEFEEYRTSEDKRINAEMVSAMRDSLNRIKEASQQLAKEQNLDVVIDTSGDSNTGVPFVLYSGDAPDLTDEVIAFLDEKPLDEEASEPEAETAGTENGE